MEVVWKTWTLWVLLIGPTWVILTISTKSGREAIQLWTFSISFGWVLFYSRRLIFHAETKQPRSWTRLSHTKRLLILKEKYGYKCEELFYECQLAGKVMDCCSDLFDKQWVMRRGLCYQTRPHVNQVSIVRSLLTIWQTEADDIGRFILSIKATSSVTNPNSNYTQVMRFVLK